MADVKLTDLPNAASLALTDLVEAVDMTGPTSKKATLTVVKTTLGIAAGDAAAQAAAEATAAADATTKANAAVATSAAAIVTERSAVRAITNATIAGASNTLTVRIANDVTGLGAGIATWLASASSANLLTAMTDKSGTGLCVFDTTPTFRTSVLINNPANTFAYTLTPGAIVANRILNLPVLTATDTIAVLALAQALTNKTLVAASNTITDTSAATGDLFRHNGTRFVRLPRGTANQLLATNAGATDIAYTSSPTMTDPVINSTSINNATSGGTVNNCTLSGTAGTVRRLRFTDAIGPTVTGFDATGVADGTILRVTAVGGTVAITSEDALSTAANRITLNANITINLPMGCFTEFQYDLTSQRWRGAAATAI